MFLPDFLESGNRFANKSGKINKPLGRAGSIAALEWETPTPAFESNGGPTQTVVLGFWWQFSNYLGGFRVNLPACLG